MLDDTEMAATEIFTPFATLMARDDWPVIVGLPALAAVFVFAVPRLGWWAALVAVVVYAAGFMAFTRSTTAHTTYAELVTALGRLPELDGSVAAGRAERTAQLVVQLGRELNLTGTDVALLEAAARCRHVGRVGRDEAPHVRRGFDDEAAARWSRDIVASSPRLEAVAELVGPDASGELRAILDVADAYEAATSCPEASAEEASRLDVAAWAHYPNITAALGAVTASADC